MQSLFYRALKAHTIIFYARKYIIMFFFLGFAWAQEASISGIVINEEDEKPIPGANIYLKKLDLGTVSQMDGSFILNKLPYGNISLTISVIGFKDVIKSMELDEESYDLGKIVMLRDTLLFQVIDIDAHDELQPHNFASNVYIAGNNFQENQKASLAFTLEKEVGMSIQSMGQATAQPVLRGYSGDRFSITEDGVTIGDLSNTSVDHTVSMDMSSYNKVRIIRGPEALLYGSNAIGGIIDVSRGINKKTRIDKPRLWTLVGTQTSNKTALTNFVGYLPINSNQQFRFSYLNRESGDERTPKGVLENTALSTNEATGTYSYFGKASQSTFAVERITMDYGIPGSYEGHIDGVDIAMKKNTQKYNYHRDISFLGFETLDLDQRFIDYNHVENEKGSKYPSVLMNQEILSIQGKFTGPHVTVGSLLGYRKFKAGGFYWTPDAKEISLAIFGLTERRINDITLQISSRAENLSIIPRGGNIFLSNIDPAQVSNRNFNIFSGAIGAYRNWKNWEFSLGTILAGRNPSIEDLFSDGPHLGTYAFEIGQPKLGLEKTIGMETSLNYNTEKSAFRLTGYRNYSPNYHISTKVGSGYQTGADWIEWGSGSSGWLYKYQMKELKSMIYCIESEVKHKLAKSINIYGSLSITRGDNLTENKPLSYMPPDKLFFSTELDLKPLSISLSLTKVLPQTRLGEFETRTDGYFLADINGSYILHSSKIVHKIIFQLDNIFDREYYNHLSRIKLIMPEKGRSIGLRYRMIF